MFWNRGLYFDVLLYLDVLPSKVAATFFLRSNSIYHPKEFIFIKSFSAKTVGPIFGFLQFLQFPVSTSIDFPSFTHLRQLDVVICGTCYHGTSLPCVTDGNDGQDSHAYDLQPFVQSDNRRRRLPVELTERIDQGYLV